MMSKPNSAVKWNRDSGAESWLRKLVRKSTQKKIKEHRDDYVRQSTEVWHPSSADLQLPDLPENLRPEARLMLNRALPKIRRRTGVRACACWQIAQALTIAADGELGYVEGVWERAPENPIAGDIAAVPHGWTSFHGHIIDLVAEFYNWRTFGDDAPWLHEPLQEYSLPDLHKFEEEFGGFGGEGLCISPIICVEGSDDYFSKFDFGLNDPDPVGRVIEDETFVFSPAKERLLRKIVSTGDPTQLVGA